MSDVAKQLQTAAFDGIKFACSHYRLVGGMRDYVHEYIHTPGGDPELLGRRLYTVEMDALFSTNTPLFPNAWPGDLSGLRDRFEREVTAELIVPGIGAIQAYCVDWPTEFDFARRRDGETAKLVFREASTNELLITSIVQVEYGSVVPKFDSAVLATQEAGLDEDLFSSIKNLVGEIQGLRGQVELQGEIMRDKVGSLIVACQELDEEVKELADPLNFKVAEAIIELGYTAIKIQQDLLKLALPIVPYVVPTPMNILDVSTAIYGNSDKAMDILRMNDVADAFDIKAGTVLRVYAPDPLASL